MGFNALPTKGHKELPKYFTKAPYRGRLKTLMWYIAILGEGVQISNWEMCDVLYYGDESGGPDSTQTQTMGVYVYYMRKWLQPEWLLAKERYGHIVLRRVAA